MAMQHNQSIQLCYEFSQKSTALRISLLNNLIQQNITNRVATRDDFELFEFPEMASSIFLSNSVEKSLFCSAL